LDLQRKQDRQARIRATWGGWAQELVERGGTKGNYEEWNVRRWGEKEDLAEKKERSRKLAETGKV
jgi:hypothetical protein